MRNTACCIAGWSDSRKNAPNAGIFCLDRDIEEVSGYQKLAGKVLFAPNLEKGI